MPLAGGLGRELERIQRIPSDYRWAELETFLGHLGYEKKEGNGSRVKFFKPSGGRIISLDKPHPGSIVKKYCLVLVVKTIKENGDLR